MKSYWANGIEWKFDTLPDGWIAIYEVYANGEIVPAIQAKDEQHALSYINMVEPVNFPVGRF